MIGLEDEILDDEVVGVFPRLAFLTRATAHIDFSHSIVLFLKDAAYLRDDEAHFTVLSVFLSFPFEVSVGRTFARNWNQLKTVPRPFGTLVHFRKEAFHVLVQPVHVFHVFAILLALLLPRHGEQCATALHLTELHLIEHRVLLPKPTTTPRQAMLRPGAAKIVADVLALSHFGVCFGAN